MIHFHDPCLNAFSTRFGNCSPIELLPSPKKSILPRSRRKSLPRHGEALGVGAKALLLRTDDVFRLFVLPADRKLDSAAIKRELKVKKTRFATPEELRELTGLIPGSVPPFGPPVLPFDLYADTAVGATYNRVAFNAGTLTNSIIMSAADWESIAQPTRFSFAQGEAPDR